MEQEGRNIHVEFHDRAQRIFFDLLGEFEFSSRKLDRKKEEFRFNELKDRYVHALTDQLKALARTLIENNRNHRQIGQLEQVFQQLIKDYLHQFVLKSRAL
jgi:hypothetical protein